MTFLKTLMPSQSSVNLRPSSETKGQIVGARESLNGRKNFGTKKSKERWEEPLRTMSYQTSSKRSPPFCLLIGQKNSKVFWHPSEVRTAATVWNWSGKTLSPGTLLAVLYFSSCHIFPPVQTFPRPLYLPLGLRGWSSSTIFWIFFKNCWPSSKATFISRPKPAPGGRIWFLFHRKFITCL